MYERFRDEKKDHLSWSVSAVLKTTKQVNEYGYEMYKNKKTRAKRAKLLFFVVKYVNLWRSCGLFKFVVLV